MTTSSRSSRSHDAPLFDAGGALLEVALTKGFGIFCNAAERAGLSDLLDAKGTYTAFMPTDAAFGKLPYGMLANLLLPEHREQLAHILSSHIAPVHRLVAEFSRWDSLTTLSGRIVAIQSVNTQVSFGIGKVVLPDIVTSNGLIHGIDRVNILREA